MCDPKDPRTLSDLLEEDLAGLSERGPGPELEYDCGPVPPPVDFDPAGMLKGYLDALAKKAPSVCDTHLFKPLHKDSETAVLFCERCGLMRVIELCFNDLGQPAVTDVPTPVAMPEDWPVPGSGTDQKEERAEILALLQKLVSCVQTAVELKVPVPDGLLALTVSARAIIADSSE